MPLRILIPTAVFAAFAFSVSSRRRSLEERIGGRWLWPALFVASFGALTWWAFGTLELFPVVFSLAYSLAVWARQPPSSPTALDRATLSRWSPMTASVLMVAAEALLTKRFDPLPLGFALLPLVAFPFDRRALSRFLSSRWSV